MSQFPPPSISVAFAFLCLSFSSPSSSFFAYITTTFFFGSELAFQISEQFEALGAGIGLKSCVIVGGVGRFLEASIIRSIFIYAYGGKKKGRKKREREREKKNRQSGA